MNPLTMMSLAALAAAAPPATAPAPAEGGIGDLLVAPTRLVLDGRKGAEVILNNIGSDPATYRVSVEFRRMTEDGGLEDVAEPDARHRIAEEMIVYAPRRVTLAPREPQSIRIAARPGPTSPTANIASTCCSAPSRRRFRPWPAANSPRASASP